MQQFLIWLQAWIFNYIMKSSIKVADRIYHMNIISLNINYALQKPYKAKIKTSDKINVFIVICI